MVIEFSLGNYRSFHKIQTISFRATSLVSENKEVDENNVAEINGQRLLKTIGVYGANGSGKSNLLQGLHFFKRMVKWSVINEQLLEGIKDPNILGVINRDKNYEYFQMVLLLDNKKYRYGFTLDYNGVAAEWLFGLAEKNETYYFKRSNNDIDINPNYFSEGLSTPYQTNLRKDALFLSFCSTYQGAVSSIIKDFIANKIKPVKQSSNHEDTDKLVQEKKEVVLNWLNLTGLNYNNIEIRKRVREDKHGTATRNEIPDIFVFKTVFDNSGQPYGSDYRLNFFQTESDGTKKYYAFIGKLYDRFENGGLIFSDEIDSNFHPLLVRKIIELFNTPSINKANAQLLFTSHDIHLMSPEIMRRDQFYFTEKSNIDATILYSLADLKGIRNNADFARQYLSGYYGALPVLGDFLSDDLSTNS